MAQLSRQRTRRGHLRHCTIRTFASSSACVRSSIAMFRSHRSIKLLCHTCIDSLTSATDRAGLKLNNSHSPESYPNISRRITRQALNPRLADTCRRRQTRSSRYRCDGESRTAKVTPWVATHLPLRLWRPGRERWLPKFWRSLEKGADCAGILPAPTSEELRALIAGEAAHRDAYGRKESRLLTAQKLHWSLACATADDFLTRRLNIGPH